MAIPLRLPANYHLPKGGRIGEKKSSRIHVFETTFAKYTRIKVIGNGGSGTVVKVKNEEGKAYALKHLSPEHVTTEKQRRFKNELHFCARNRHPNIITVVDWGFVLVNERKCPFYVMKEYPVTLRGLMKDALKADRVLPFFMRVLDGVESAHEQNIWHRDLKPENILCDPDTDELVVADFGIAHFEEDLLQTAVVTKPGEVLANRRYAAPEQLEKRASVDHRADIFALGMILNEMFTGMVPYGTNHKVIRQIAPQYGYLDHLISSMMEQAPDKRPASIAEIRRELEKPGHISIVSQQLGELGTTIVSESGMMNPLVNDPAQLVAPLPPVPAENVEIVPGAGDTKAPVLVSFDIPSPSAHVGVGPAQVELRAHLVDELSGVAGRSYRSSPTQVRFRSPSGRQSVTAVFRAGQHMEDGTARDGHYRSTAEFPQFAEAGVWRVDSFDLVDQCGNTARLTANEMQAAGFPTTITVYP